MRNFNVLPIEIIQSSLLKSLIVHLTSLKLTTYTPFWLVCNVTMYIILATKHSNHRLCEFQFFLTTHYRPLTTDFISPPRDKYRALDTLCHSACPLIFIRTRRSATMRYKSRRTARIPQHTKPIVFNIVRNLKEALKI